MKPYGKRILSALLVLLAVLLPVRAQALGRIDTQRAVTLTIQYTCDGKAAPNVGFDLYRVADVSEDMRFTLTGAFQGYPVSLEDQSASGWRALAATLAGYAERDALKPLASGKTDQRGTLIFPAKGGTMRPGLYLALGGSYQSGRYTYTAEPFLVSLPDLNDTGTNWLYNVTVSPKYTVWDEDDPENDTISRRVLKVWRDKGNEDSRPTKVTVELLRNGRVYDTVTLRKSNNWRYTWDDLDARYRWTVVEQAVPGYTVSVSREGATFVVTNSRQSDAPDFPDQPDPPNPPDNPNDPYTPQTPYDPDKPGDPDALNFPDVPDTPDGAGRGDPSTPSNRSGGPKLPQTGVLWWPVPVLLAAGLVLIAVGVTGRREDHAE